MRKKLFKKFLIINLIMIMTLLRFTFWYESEVKATAEEGKFTDSEFPYDIKFKTISNAGNSILALDENNNLWAWGNNNYGQLGDGTTTKRKNPVKIQTSFESSQICTSGETSFAIDTDGNIWGWGSTFYGTVGNGVDYSIDSSAKVLNPIQVTTGRVFKKVVASLSSVLALDSDGNIWGWGYNGCGQILNEGKGNSLTYGNSSYCQNVPIQITSGTKYVDIQTNGNTSGAIDSDGNLWMWGYNGSSELAAPMDTYYFSVLSGYGCYGSYEPIQIKSGTKFKKLAIGGGFVFAIDTSDNLWAWGRAREGYLGIRNPTTNTNYDSENFSIPVPTLITNNVKNIYAARNSSIMILEDKIKVCGLNDKGEFGDGTTTDSETFITMSYDYKQFFTANNRSIYALDKNGDLWGWGDNNYGQMADGTTTDKTVPIQITGTRYAVTFINEGVVEKIENVIQGGSATAPELTKTGYTLSWDTDFSNVTSDLTVNAIWTANTNTAYRVEHYKQNITLDGYELEETENKTGTTGAVAVAIAKTYEGFTENSDYEGRVASGNVAGDGSLVLKLYYDRNTYTITYEPNYSVPGGVSKPVAYVGEFKYGESIQISENYHTRTGYEFVNWNTKADGTGKSYEVGDIYSENESIILYAQWENEKYTVNFMNGTETVKTETVNYGSSATAPELTKAGYNLSWDTDFSNITSDLTVNAVWTPNTDTAYKVEHYKQNTTLDGYDLFETEELTGTTDTNVIAIAKTFEGFTENTEYEGRVGSGNLAGDGSLVLKLYYDRNTYTITYEPNYSVPGGVSKPVPYVGEFKYGESVQISENYHTRTGYEFVNWNTKADGTGKSYEVGDIYSENESLVLYAQWKNKKYTVTFINGTETVKTETVVLGESATAPELTKVGYTLSWDKEFNNITSDLTVNAIWTPNTNTPYKVEHYKRNLDGEVIGYDLFETEELTGTTDTNVTAVAKEYEGFTENTTHVDRVATGTIAGDGSLVLKLYYDRNSYSIIYELNGGRATNELTNSYTYGKDLILSSRVTKPGYVFVGWYDNVNLEGSTITRINAGEIGDKTFYAKWTSQEQFYITSEKHSINTEEKQITKVSPNTNVETFINNLSTNGTVKILNLNGDEVALNGLVGTGYKLQVEYKGTKYEYEIAVRGDLDGNGKTTITDLSILNQLLVKKLTVTGIREKAADIDYSEKTTITDLSMLNQAIVGKINL